MRQVSTPPAPASARVAALFDRVADTYESVGVPWFEPIAAHLVELMAAQPGEQAVDLGCGRGAALIPLGQAVGASGKVTGIDLSPRMVELAAARAGELGLNTVQVRVMDAAAVSLPAGEADLVVASLVLFFLPEPLDALRGWVGLLRPAGRLGISTFGDRDPLWHRLDAVFQPYLPPQLLDARTSGQSGPFSSDAGVEELFARAGLVDVRTAHSVAEVAFAGADAWRTWSASHGQRVMWDHVPEAEQAAVLGRAAQVLADGAGADGVTRLSQQVRYTLGRAG